MLIFVTGEDTFRSREFLHEQIEKFRKTRDPQNLNISIVDAQKKDVNEIFGDIFAPPFLGQKRLVVLENLLTSGRKDLLGRFQETLESKRFPENSVIIIWHDASKSKLKEVTTLLKLLDVEQYVYRFETLSSLELGKWVYERVRRSNSAIDEQAKQYLAENAENTWQLANTVDQLVSYKIGKTIERSDVELFLGRKEQANVFSFAEAVAAGNKKLAFSLLSNLRAMGEEDMYLFSMIIREYRILLQISDYTRIYHTASADQMAMVLSLHPFVIKKTLPRLAILTYDFLESRYRALLEYDSKIKTGFLPAEKLLEMVVVES